MTWKQLGSSNLNNIMASKQAIHEVTIPTTESIRFNYIVQVDTSYINLIAMIALPSGSEFTSLEPDIFFKNSGFEVF